jgi:SAM-dependent methyltransferase
MPDFSDEIAAIRSRTASYATDPEFQLQWFGLNARSMNLRAQQMRVFGNLVGSVTRSLHGWRILDVGCGSGFWLRIFLEFQARSEDLIGIDASGERLGLALAKNRSIVLVQTDGVTIPFQDASFDLATQFVAFSSMPSAALRIRVAEEISRVVKPGGYVFWWDHQPLAAVQPGDSLRPSDYFDWPVRELAVGELPRPSECLRAPDRLGSFCAGLDRLGYPLTHNAALLGPKP